MKGKFVQGIQVVGPVRFLRYEGALGKQDVRIEVWPIPTESGEIQYTAELSRACKNLMEAVKKDADWEAASNNTKVVFKDSGYETALTKATPTEERYYFRH